MRRQLLPKDLLTMAERPTDVKEKVKRAMEPPASVSPFALITAGTISSGSLTASSITDAMFNQQLRSTWGQQQQLMQYQPWATNTVAGTMAYTSSALLGTTTG